MDLPEIPEVDTVDSLAREAQADIDKMNGQLSRTEIWTPPEGGPGSPVVFEIAWRNP